MFNLDETTTKGRQAMDAVLKSYAEATKGLQAISAETVDYSKKAFQDAVTHVEDLFAVRSIESAMQLQTSFLKSSYEEFVGRSTKIGEIYADMIKTAYKPYEAATPAPAPVKTVKSSPVPATAA